MKNKRFIHFNNVLLNAKKHQKEINAVFDRIVASGNFLNGEENKILEKNLSAFLGGGFVCTTHSGHYALASALSVLNLKENDEILFPVNVYPTAFPVCLSKGKPVPVDVDENGQMDYLDLKKKITKNAKAIVVVHLYGNIGNIAEIKQIAKSKKITLIEDCAQAFGSTYNKKPVGTFGDIACFSFYPTKNLSTFGDGGAIYTKKKHFYSYFLQVKSYGESERYLSKFIAGHSRLSEINAGILNLFFNFIDNDFAEKKKVAEYYINLLEKQNLSKFIRVLKSSRNSDPVLHLLVLEVKKRDELKKFLEDKKIPVAIHYPSPVHLLPAFSFLGYKKGDFPMSERLSKNIISLPFHQYLSKEEIDFIIKNIKSFYNV